MRTRRLLVVSSAVLAGLGLAAACSRVSAPGTTTTSGPPTDAAAFVKQANATLLAQANALSRAQWVAANFITEDTEQISAAATADYVASSMRLAKEAARYPGNGNGNADVARQLLLLKLAASPLPAPSDTALQTELTRIVAGMEAGYGRGKYCPPGKPCQTIDDLSRLMATSRDPKALLEAWEGWHAIAPPLKQPYERFAQLGNQGAKELGFADLGAFWRAGYDMPPDDFAKEVDRLWIQVKPLYDQLHAHVRRRLGATYGTDVVRPDAPIPAHLLGNMWAQQWGNIYDLVGPPGRAPGYDVGDLLKAKKTDALGMVRYGEGFFTSLGFAPLPETFWKRSLFVRPQDRDVVCHASAWNVDNVDDLRIKMCIEINAEDFVTVHHELGHNFYQRAYNTQPFLYRTGANDGFHEAIGDAVALSITPQYLVKVGLLPSVPQTQDDVEFLLRMALDKVAFLPFGLLVDQWRWKVFSGEITPAEYNTAWWQLREQYQGVAAPGPRPADAFDAGAKYHVPANTPYTRYFLAHILQFQMHRAMCKAAGHIGPLHTCSIYGNKEVGARLQTMLALGASKPWPEALEALTGERQMDATAILDYFAPLRAWLEAEAAAGR
ncbi:M2 family metallopeptidase [Luteitalea sp.]|uniref:M2 family metallopeptidase n=1 Tax=Luteitalea sp. TaxID=2004800 RepID=UPI0025BCE7F1|nr:M2 family metallopeptidase [Luteitalea sp.]